MKAVLSVFIALLLCGCVFKDGKSKSYLDTSQIGLFSPNDHEYAKSYEWGTVQLSWKGGGRITRKGKEWSTPYRLSIVVRSIGNAQLTEVLLTSFRANSDKGRVYEWTKPLPVALEARVGTTREGVRSFYGFLATENQQKFEFDFEGKEVLFTTIELEITEDGEKSLITLENDWHPSMVTKYFVP